MGLTQSGATGSLDSSFDEHRVLEVLRVKEGGGHVFHFDACSLRCCSGLEDLRREECARAQDHVWSNVRIRLKANV